METQTHIHKQTHNPYEQTVRWNMEACIALTDMTLTPELHCTYISMGLRYLWNHTAILKSYPEFRDAVLQRCKEWEKHPDAQPILSTILLTQTILSSSMCK